MAQVIATAKEVSQAVEFGRCPRCKDALTDLKPSIGKFRELYCSGCHSSYPMRLIERKGVDDDKA